MINFRFYLVSIVAVFLALAVGVVMGYGVLGQPTVKGLQSRIDTIGAKAEDIDKKWNGQHGTACTYKSQDRPDGRSGKKCFYDVHPCIMASIAQIPLSPRSAGPTRQARLPSVSPRG